MVRNPRVVIRNLLLIIRNILAMVRIGVVVFRNAQVISRSLVRSLARDGVSWMGSMEWGAHDQGHCQEHFQKAKP